MTADLGRFFRVTPVDSLKALLKLSAPQTVARIDWEMTDRTKLVDVIREALDALDDGLRNKVYGQIDRLCQFRGRDGRRALRAALPDAALRAFDKCRDVHACAIFVLLRSETIFENALATFLADRLMHGRGWSGFDFAPGQAPVLLPRPRLNPFKEELRALLADDGPRPRITVQRFTRREPNPDGSGRILAREQFTVYAEGAPEAALAFDDQAELFTQTLRPVHEAALLFDPRDRSLDVVTESGNQNRRRAIAEAFVQNLLQPGATLARRSRRALNLDVLKQNLVFPHDPEDRIRSVEVTRVTLKSPDYASTTTIEVSRKNGRAQRDLYEHAKQIFGSDGALQWPDWPVAEAKVRVTFEPEPAASRPKIVSVEMRMPDRTNLHDQTEYHRRIADTLLSRWRLYSG